MPEYNPTSTTLHAIFVAERDAALQQFVAQLQATIGSKNVAKGREAVQMNEIHQHMQGAIEYASYALARFTETVSKNRGRIILGSIISLDDLTGKVAQAKIDESAAKEAYEHAEKLYLKVRKEVDET
jgi:hypothetical protein